MHCCWLGDVLPGSNTNEAVLVPQGYKANRFRQEGQVSDDQYCWVVLPVTASIISIRYKLYTMLYITKWIALYTECVYSDKLLTQSHVSPIFSLKIACKASSPVMFMELLSLPMSSEYANRSHTLFSTPVMLLSSVLRGFWCDTFCEIDQTYYDKYIYISSSQYCSTHTYNYNI